VKRVSASFTWGGGGLVDEAWVEGGNGRTDPNQQPMGMLGDSGHYPISAYVYGHLIGNYPPRYVQHIQSLIQ